MLARNGLKQTLWNNAPFGVVINTKTVQVENDKVESSYNLKISAKLHG